MVARPSPPPGHAELVPRLSERFGTHADRGKKRPAERAGYASLLSHPGLVTSLPIPSERAVSNDPFHAHRGPRWTVTHGGLDLSA